MGQTIEIKSSEASTIVTQGWLAKQMDTWLFRACLRHTRIREALSERFSKFRNECKDVRDEPQTVADAASIE